MNIFHILIFLCATLIGSVHGDGSKAHASTPSFRRTNVTPLVLRSSTIPTATTEKPLVTSASLLTIAESLTHDVTEAPDSDFGVETFIPRTGVVFNKRPSEETNSVCHRNLVKALLEALAINNEALLSQLLRNDQNVYRILETFPVESSPLSETKATDVLNWLETVIRFSGDKTGEAASTRDEVDSSKSRSTGDVSPFEGIVLLIQHLKSIIKDGNKEDWKKAIADILHIVDGMTGSSEDVGDIVMVIRVAVQYLEDVLINEKTGAIDFDNLPSKILKDLMARIKDGLITKVLKKAANWVLQKIGIGNIFMTASIDSSPSDMSAALHEMSPSDMAKLDLDAQSQIMLLTLTSPKFKKLFEKAFHLYADSEHVNTTTGDSNSITSFLDEFMEPDTLDNNDYLNSKLSSMMNVVFGALSCPFNPEEVERSTKASQKNIITFLPETCEPQYGALKNQSVNMADYAAEFNFEDLRVQNAPQLKAELPDFVSKQVVDEEGLFHFLLYRSCVAGGKYSDQARIHGDLKPSEPLIPGWKLEAVIQSQRDEVQSKGSAKDHVLLLSIPISPNKSNKCQVVVTATGSAEAYSWDPKITTETASVINSEIRARKGYVLVANAAKPTLLKFIAEQTSEGCAEEDLDLIFTGHSISGGMAQLIGVLIAEALPKAKIDIITFGSPSVFNEAGVRYYKENVNARNFIFDLDPMSAVSKNLFETRGSQNSSNSIFFKDNAAVAKMDLMKEVGSKNYLNLQNNLIDFKLDGISKLFITINIPVSLQVPISHHCAYSCKFSTYCKSDAEKAWTCRDCPSATQPITLPGISVFGNEF